ncbi:methylenetetrahydrofolate reductase C-terminal domain-containing protein [Ruania alkalisoli]|uniref:Methylenetetrahydrofolate reductase n=1 Tax=Ruania alkalisoli TaxID=2779775 RepID=A0A7M1SUU1_9MICO|nr:methylenetetrahydrofolate reductase C-terminal domain-containing protein [Ruania alkalisoli]QOR71251.1 methylenetetrahydrofolate reductase C-terminal domain-containing protein [Ruania alkalisoli]
MTTSLALSTVGGCPKRMTYGPCGGVAADGTCEVTPEPCPFVTEATVPWPGPGPATTPPTAEGLQILDLLQRRPIVVAGMPARAMDVASVEACGRQLAGRVDAVLAGDSGRARVQFPPTYRAELIRRAGLRAWPGLNCRDRNRVALEGELAGLAAVGAAGVHCVTGDHPAGGHRPDAQPVFDLESTELVGLARKHGLLVSVAESPASPPVHRRAERLAEKVRAGAQLCLTQYCGGADEVRAFVAAMRQAGADVPLLPGVPVVLDVPSAELLASFAAAVLPAGYVESVLTASDPFRAGVEAAIRYGEELLAVAGVAGVVVAGAAEHGTEEETSAAIGQISAALGGGS